MKLSKIKYILLLFAISINLVSVSSVHAAGINSECTSSQVQDNVQCFPTAAYDEAGKINYVHDLGPLGYLNNQEAVDLLREAYDVWENVPSSSAAFNKAGTLDVDIDLANYVSDFQSVYSTPPQSDDVIVFDANGEIFQALFGYGPEVQTISGPVWKNEAGLYDSGFAILNGASIPDQSKRDSFKAALVRAIGTMLNLDASATNVDLYELPSQDTFAVPGTNESNLDQLPIMFPYQLTNNFDLGPDDISSVSSAYPNQLTELLGSIKGVVLKPNNQPLLGVNITAYKAFTDDGVALPLIENAVSSVSGKTSPNGDFSIEALGNGSYYLRLESISREFTVAEAAFSVGPHQGNQRRAFLGYYNGPGNDLVNSIDQITNGTVVLDSNDNSVEGIVIQP